MSGLGGCKEKLGLMYRICEEGCYEGARGDVIDVV